MISDYYRRVSFLELMDMPLSYINALYKMAVDSSEEDAKKQAAKNAEDDLEEVVS